MTATVMPHGLYFVSRMFMRANRLLGPLLLASLIGGCASTRPIRVGMTTDYPPFCVQGPSGQDGLGRDGFDVTLLRRLADDSGWHLRPVNFEWPGLTKLLRRGDFDLAACGITARRDRGFDMLFTRPYAVSGAVVVIPGEATRRFADIEAFDNPDIRLAVNAGGHLEKVARRRFRRASIHTVADNLSLRDELTLGRADAVISDIYESSRWPGVRVLGPFTRDVKVLALPLERLELREQVSAWLAEREADGWLPALRRTLGVESAAISAASVCGEALGSALEARLALMHRVAAIKRHLGLPITDPAQEARVLAKVRKQAAELNLAEEDVANLFRTLIRLAKAVQERSHEPFQPGMTLESVRALVAASSTPLMQELGRCGPPLAGHEDELSQALQSHLADLLHPEELSELLNVLPPRRGFVSHARSVVSPDIPSVDAGVRH